MISINKSIDGRVTDRWYTVYRQHPIHWYLYITLYWDTQQSTTWRRIIIIKTLKHKGLWKKWTNYFRYSWTIIPLRREVSCLAARTSCSVLSKLGLQASNRGKLLSLTAALALALALAKAIFNFFSNPTNWPTQNKHSEKRKSKLNHCNLNYFITVTRIQFTIINYK